MSLFSKRKDDLNRKVVKTNLAIMIDDINNQTIHQENLVEIGPNVVMPESLRGTYFITDNSGYVEGAIYCSDYRDVISVGLTEEHADIIHSVVFFDAIVGRGITPLQTLEDSIPEKLREALGFVGPEKDEYTSANRWVLK